MCGYDATFEAKNGFWDDYEFNEKELERVKLILVVLDASRRPVKGKTRLVKYVFMLQKALEGEGMKAEGYAFLPFPQGPYNPIFSLDLQILVQKGLIREEAEEVEIDTQGYRGKATRYNYTITEEGKKMLKKLLKGPEARHIMELARKVRETWDNKPLWFLLFYTHTLYPELHKPSH